MSDVDRIINEIKALSSSDQEKVWGELWKDVGPMGNMPYSVFKQFIPRVVSTNVEVALVGPNGESIFLIRRKEDEYFNGGWHIPGGIYVPRNSRLKMCQFVASKEIHPNLILKKVVLVDAFNFWLIRQDPRSHAAPLVFLAWGLNTRKLYDSITERGQFFSSLPDDIMDVKAENAVSPSSHEIMFKAAMAALTKDPVEKKELELEVLKYQTEYC